MFGVQVLRADKMAENAQGHFHMQEPQRSLLKPELIWQYEKGLQQTLQQVCAAAKHAFIVDYAHDLHDTYQALMCRHCSNHFRNDTNSKACIVSLCMLCYAG